MPRRWKTSTTKKKLDGGQTGNRKRTSEDAMFTESEVFENSCSVTDGEAEVLQIRCHSPE